MGRQLTTDQLVSLEEHSYSCTSASLLDPIMQNLWCWLVNKCPMSLAPNLITITGLIINIITCLILIYYSPDAQQEVPRWACFLCALGLFIYQSLDAIDGKQARRTGTSSPLGELFDHGCDSLSTVFVSLSVCCAVQLGSHPYWMFFQCVMAVLLFYCAHWQTYVSGTLRFGYIDVTEAQFTVIVILLLSSVFGSGFWSGKVPTMGIALKCLPTMLGTAAGIVALINNFNVILFGRGAGKNGSTVAILGTPIPLVYIYIIIGTTHAVTKAGAAVPNILWAGAGRNGSTVAFSVFDESLMKVGAFMTFLFQIALGYSYIRNIHRSGAGKNGSTVAGTSVLSPVVPLFLMVSPAILIAWKSPDGIYLHNPSLYLLTFGFVAARVTNRLVVAHMTKSEMAYTDASMFGPAALFINQYFNVLISEHILLWIVCAYVTYDLIKYCREVCLDICDHLQISLFVIDSPGAGKSHSTGEKNGSSSSSSSSTSKYNTRNKAKMGKGC